MFTQYILTVVWRVDSLSWLQITRSFAISFIFSQPTAAGENDCLFIRCSYLDFFHENAMTRTTAFISNVYFLNLNSPEEKVTQKLGIIRFYS